MIFLIKSTSTFLLASTISVFANTAPTVVVESATMRAGTTLMDVVYRVNDPDDATVKVRALAFSDGVRSFANVLRPVTFAEGTETNLGDAITANESHTLTWNVAADWNVDLGQVKFEVLAMDGRGLLAFDWITIPAAGGKPELTISKDAPSDTQLLDALFWQYASGDTKLTLENGILKCTSGTLFFDGSILAAGVTITKDTAPYVMREMNLDPASYGEVGHAHTTARAGLSNAEKWHVANRPYNLSSYVKFWGRDDYGQADLAERLSTVVAISAGRNHNLVMTADGHVFGCGKRDNFDYGEAIPPAGLSDVTAIAAGSSHSLALKSDGTVVGWARDDFGQATPPAGLTNVIAIAAGASAHSLALKSDGTVVGWGNNLYGQATPPVWLTNVTAIAAGENHSSAIVKNPNP